jgi:DNA-binding PadR family transcriptional regulator
MWQHKGLSRSETAILASIPKVREAYAVTIHDHLRESNPGSVISLGSIYFALEKLEDYGFVSSWPASPTIERGWRAKRCYGLEGLGKRALMESVGTANQIQDLILDVWGPEWAKY